MIKTNELILFRNLKYQKLFDLMANIINDSADTAMCYQAVHDLLDFSNNYNFAGNLYHVFLTFILSNNENSFTLSEEMKGKRDGSIVTIAMNDFTIFRQLFAVDLLEIDKKLGIQCFAYISNYIPPLQSGKIFNNELRQKINAMAKELSTAKNINQFYDVMDNFYSKHGVGKYGFHKAFRINSDEAVYIEPITNTASITFDDLIGYEWQKEKLIKNTLDFLEDKPANNVLLYGDSGTGKSSSIKAVLNQFAPKGLRMIEIYKHQFCYLSQIISVVKNRNYKFIIYMDDLSFETFETDYKYLKAVIEGGLETKPKNVLIYATSNRRHLIQETTNDNNLDDLHRNETSAEKLSLAARFGISILYSSPTKSEFDYIIQSLAAKSNINLPDDILLSKAHEWELHYGGLSGRTAQQFINYIKANN